MAKFMSGPPGGRTLPLTANRLSDLAGGVYGPGASVASTGLNAARPVIKTAGARAAGETWEDLMEYYLVCDNPSSKFYMGLSHIVVVQCRSRRDRLCIPPRQDLLPWKHLHRSWRNSFWRRRCECRATGLRPCASLLPTHCSTNMATRPS